MRCSRCGNENPGQNRFCGMCGASLLGAAAQPAAQQQPVPVSTPNATTAELTAARTEAAKPARVEPAPNNHPSISGPSFLGLNDSSPSHSAPRKRARLSIDPHSAPGSNLEYLLDEDEEEQPSHWGPGKILLILIALALALGFGYLRWKTHGFAWLNPPTKKPDATVAQNAPLDNNPTQPAPAPPPEAQPPAIQPAPTAAQPSPDASASNSTPSNAPPTSTPATSPAPESSAKPGDTPSNGDNSSNTPPPDKDSAASEEPTAAPPPKTTEKPKPAPKPFIPKPSPVTRPALAADPVAEAQKYLYGKGVSQDCDRGMRLLKPAANQSNPKAMVEMGALYSAGLCTPHDLPTAYRWFALALRKDPDNTAVQADLQKLWSEMTPPERQLAIKLSQ